MGLGVIVDIVIGLSVFFWLVATASSFVVEALNSILNTRARALELFIREMLVGTKDTWLGPWRRALSFLPFAPQPASSRPGAGDVLHELDVTTHPLIRRLYKPANDVSKKDTAPSYIPAELFSLALLDRLSQHYSNAQSRPLTIADLRAIVNSTRLPADLAVALRPLLDAANHDIDAFRHGIERWYDSVMDRATGWFRRYTQVWLFVVAFALAAIFNLDALYVGQRLKDDPALRDAGVRLGQQVAAAGRDAGAELLQMYTLRAAFADGAWRTELSALGAASAAASAAAPASSAASAASAAATPLLVDADRLAQRVQPMLLRHGGTVTPLLALQAEALRIEHRCAKVSEGRDTCVGSAWKELAKKDSALLIAVGAACRARLLAGGPGTDSAQRNAALNLTLAGLANHDLCKPEKGALVPEDVAATPSADPGVPGHCLPRIDPMGRLWSNAGLVWSVEVGRAAWCVRWATRVNSDNADVVAPFHRALEHGLADARAALADVDAGAGLLPRLGRVTAAVEHWRAGEGCCEPTKRALLSLLGWFITAFMASLGAPLWFDLIAHLTNRRIAGPKPEATAP
jgi:hypothetical protein